MSIQLVTYANQTVTPTNDAIIYERAINQNGIFYGCNVTVSGNEVHISGGYGIVCGREFTIQSEAIAVTLAPSGTLDGRLYVRLDLADADAPIQLLTATGNTLPPLEQDSDVNYINGVWEMELATFDVGVSALSDVVETFETITGTQKELATETLTPTISATTGTVVGATCKRYGNVVYLTVAVRNTSSVAVGSAIFQGTVSGIPLPANIAQTATYYGARALVASFSSVGLLILRNTYSAATAMGANDAAYISVTYVV